MFPHFPLYKPNASHLLTVCSGRQEDLASEDVCSDLFFFLVVLTSLGNEFKFSSFFLMIHIVIFDHHFRKNCDLSHPPHLAPSWFIFNFFYLII